MGGYGDFGTGGQPDMFGQGGTGGSGGGSATLEELLASGGAVQYQRVACYDEALGCEAARSLIPADWQAGGGAYWNGQSRAGLAVIDFFAYSPDNAQRVGFISEVSYSNPNPTAVFQPATNEGGFDKTDLAPVKTFVSAEDYAYEFMYGYFGATGAQVVNVQYPQGDDLASLQAYEASQQQAINQLFAQNNAQAAASNGVQMEAKIQLSGAYVDLLMDVNGVTYKVRVCCVVELSYYVSSIPGTAYYSAFQEDHTFWQVPLFFYYAAEQSLYDESLATIGIFAENLRVNQQWQDALEKAQLQLTQIQFDNWRDQLQQITQQCQQAALASSQSHSQNYSSSGSSGSSYEYNGNVINGWTNAIVGNSYYESDDGSPVLLDGVSYQHTYNDGNGGFIQSDTPIWGLNEATFLGEQPPG